MTTVLKLPWRGFPWYVYIHGYNNTGVTWGHPKLPLGSALSLCLEWTSWCKSSVHVHQLYWLHEILNSVHQLHEMLNSVHQLHEMLNSVHQLHVVLNSVHQLHEMLNSVHTCDAPFATNIILIFRRQSITLLACFISLFYVGEHISYETSLMQWVPILLADKVQLRTSESQWLQVLSAVILMTQKVPVH